MADKSADVRCRTQDSPSTLDILFYLSMAFLVAKSTGIVCLIGIGLGFGLSSWIIYKVYSHTRRQTRHDSDSTSWSAETEESSDTDPLEAKGLNGLAMGNESSLQLSAGVSFDDDRINGSVTGVRHRNIIHKSERPTTQSGQSNLGASIIDDESGAYISRSAFLVDSEGDNSNCEPPTNGFRHDIKSVSSISQLSGTNLVNNTWSSHMESSSIDTNSQLTLPSDQTGMNDSGYLDIDSCNNKVTTGMSHSDSLLSPTPTAFSVSDDQECEIRQRDVSEISSLSDQHMHDLALSDLSSCQGSGDPDLDEEVVQIELEGQNSGEPEDEELASTETLLDLVEQCIQDDTGQFCETMSIDQNNESPRECLSLPDTITKDSSTDCSDPWRESNLSSPFSPFSRRDTDSRASSVFGSPLLSIRSEHSRSSSITSADVELEASSFTKIEPTDKLDIMKLELEEIKREMGEVEAKLGELMSTDTTKLYFNIDNMKKLTEVVLNSGDINLTSSEIAKAFQILRKYRYTFTTPERKPTFAHNEAETCSAGNSSNKRTLPYLDLADPYSARRKQQSVTDWVDGIFHHNYIHSGGITDPPTVIEQTISDFCQGHPHAKGYSLLADKYGFTKLYKLVSQERACLSAAYLSSLIHYEYTCNEHSKYFRDIDLLDEKITELVSKSHTYLKDWRFTQLNVSAEVLPTMKLCLKTLLQNTERITAAKDITERISLAMDMFNHASSSRRLIIEGLRLLMFIRVVELYDGYACGDDVPLHAWMLFSRESSCNPRHYFTNHIQTITAQHPDEIDISVLADVLGVQIELFRPEDPESSEFSNIYPEMCDTSKTCAPLAMDGDKSFVTFI